MNATLWTEAGWILLRADFHRDAVNAWKSEIPPKYRRWDPQQKIWKFDPSVTTTLEAILERFSYDVHVLEQQEQNIVVQDGADQYMAFINALPEKVLKDAYKKACLELHPDRGGSAEQMAKLTAAWTVITKDKKQSKGDAP